MKAFFLLFVCVIFASIGSGRTGGATRERLIPEYLRQPLRDLHADCLVESGVKEDQLHVCLDRQVPDIQEVKCYIDCLLRKSMIYNSEGKVDLNRVRYLVPSDVYVILDELQRECGHIHEPDGCETAYQATKCFFEKHENTIEFCHLLVFDYKVGGYE